MALAGKLEAELVQNIARLREDMRAIPRIILRRLEGSRFSVIEREWAGETVVILGGGPSLTADDFELVRQAHADGRVRCIAVNDAYLAADFADVLYAADASWHDVHSKGVAKLGMSAEEVRERYASFAGQRCSVEDQLSGLHDERIHILRTDDFRIAPMLASTNDGTLVSGRNGSHQAMNVGIRAGATTALLCGVDGKRDGSRTHWHGGHGKPLSDDFFEGMKRSFSAAENVLKAMGVTVLNCSPDSAIESFPKVALAEALRLAC